MTNCYPRIEGTRAVKRAREREHKSVEESVELKEIDSREEGSLKQELRAVRGLVKKRKGKGVQEDSSLVQILLFSHLLTCSTTEGRPHYT